MGAPSYISATKSGVSQKNTSEAIQSVYGVSETTFSGPLPCSATQNTLTKEMKSLSRQPVFEAASNLSIKYDGTTKSLGHMVDVEIATKDGPLVMSITQHVGGTASEYVRSITKNISRVEQTSVGSAGQLSILNKVSNTMIDRCVTNTAVDDQLEALKGSKLNRFRCAMHPLDAIAKACEKVVKRIPFRSTQNNQKQITPSNTESPTHRRLFPPLLNCFMTINTAVSMHALSIWKLLVQFHRKMKRNLSSTIGLWVTVFTSTSLAVAVCTTIAML